MFFQHFLYEVDGSAYKLSTFLVLIYVNCSTVCIAWRSRTDYIALQHIVCINVQLHIAILHKSDEQIFMPMEFNPFLTQNKLLVRSLSYIVKFNANK